MTALRVALIGYGVAGRVLHGPLLRATPGLIVTAIVVSNHGRRARAAADFLRQPFFRVLTTCGLAVRTSTWW